MKCTCQRDQIAVCITSWTSWTFAVTEDTEEGTEKKDIGEPSLASSQGPGEYGRLAVEGHLDREFVPRHSHLRGNEIQFDSAPNNL